jgi:hypothetical protein
MKKLVLALMLISGPAFAGLLLQSGGLGQSQSGSDTTPNQFTFTDQTDTATSTTITSAPVTVDGIDVSITCNASGGTIDKNSDGSFSSSQSVSNNDTLRAQHTSSALNATSTNTLVACNSVSDTFTSTTEAGGGGGGVFFQPDIGALADGNTLVSSGTFQDENNDNNGDSIVQSAVTRPGGQSKAIRIAYVQDESMSTLVVYGTTASPAGPMPATTSLFVRSYEMVDAGWATHWPQGLKTARIYAGNQGQGCISAPYDIPYISEKIIYPGYSTSPDPRVEDYVTSGSWAYCNRTEIEANYTVDMTVANGLPYLRTGVWYKWERWYVMNSGNDVADGILQIWIDDVLVLNRTNVVYRSVSAGTGGAGGTSWGSMWFGGNFSNTGSFTATPPIYRYIDSPYLSTTLDR